MSTLIDMDDPLAAAPPRDTPPSPSRDGENGQSKGREPGDAASAEPKRRGRKPGDAQLKLDLKEIEEKLGNLLELPAVPMAAAGDVWPAQHIEARAHPLAKAIAQSCKDNPQLREKLLQLLRVGDGAGLVLAALAYAAPVALYYGLLPVPPLVKHQFQIPDRAEAREPSIVEQMRAQERAQQIRQEQIASQRARQAEDPQESPGTGSNRPKAQARTPPAI